jgi:tetrahedral aminopeptidase
MNTALLKKICETPGAPGFEKDIRTLIIQELNGLCDEVRLDAMGNIHAIRKGESDKKLMIAAHMDEISFIVTHIDDDGFVRFHTLGGFDPKTLTSQRVIIHGKEKITGVMGTKPIHIMTPEEKSKAPKISDYFIDTGIAADKLRELISVGTPITRAGELIVMGDCVNSKSLDNRVSVFILIETLKALKDKKIPYNLYGVFTVQEEVGLRGAITASSGINPDFGLALDVTLACDVPGISAHEYITKMGKGAAIKVMDGSVISDYRMVEFLKETAITHQIPYQMEILPAGGTDTGGIQRSASGGAIVGAISIPTRYLHQVIEMAHIGDIENCIDLLTKAVLDMDNKNWNF